MPITFTYRTVVFLMQHKYLYNTYIRTAYALSAKGRCFTNFHEIVQIKYVINSCSTKGQSLCIVKNLQIKIQYQRLQIYETAHVIF